MMCGRCTVHEEHLAIEDDDRSPRSERLRFSTSLLGEGTSPATCQRWLRLEHVVCRSHQNMQWHRKISEAPERPSGAAAKATWTFTSCQPIEIVCLDILGICFPYVNPLSSNHLSSAVGEDSCYIPCTFYFGYNTSRQLSFLNILPIHSRSPHLMFETRPTSVSTRTRKASSIPITRG